MIDNLFPYFLFMGCGAVVCVLWFFLSFRRKTETKKAAALGGLILLLGAALGLFGARLGWVLLRFNVILAQPKELLTLRYDELSFWGGAAGVALAVFLSAKIMKLPARDVLNAFAPMGALMAAAARFAEGFLGLYGVGFVEQWYDEGLFFPITVWNEFYYGYCLAVFMFSGIFCLIAMVLSLVHGKERNRAVRTVFYLCLPQILFECMRMMAIKWLFVPLEQLVCFLFCEGVLVVRAFAAGKSRFRSWIPAIAGLAVCGVIVVCEFMLDGKITLGETFIPHWITYSIMAAALIGLTIAEHGSNKRIHNS
jgi:hypothetical protein